MHENSAIGLGKDPCQMSVANVGLPNEVASARDHGISTMSRKLAANVEVGVVMITETARFATSAIGLGKGHLRQRYRLDLPREASIDRSAGMGRKIDGTRPHGEKVVHKKVRVLHDANS